MSDILEQLRNVAKSRSDRAAARWGEHALDDADSRLLLEAADIIEGLRRDNRQMQRIIQNHARRGGVRSALTQEKRP